MQARFNAALATKPNLFAVRAESANINLNLKLKKKCAAFGKSRRNFALRLRAASKKFREKTPQNLENQIQNPEEKKTASLGEAEPAPILTLGPAALGSSYVSGIAECTKCRNPPSKFRVTFADQRNLGGLRAELRIRRSGVGEKCRVATYQLFWWLLAPVAFFHNSGTTCAHRPKKRES